MANANIIVVEDEFIIAFDLKQRLESLGYHVACLVSNGKDAIQKTTEIKPELVIMDITLKGEMDGIETAREINRQFNIPVIHITGNVDKNTLKEIENTNHFGYLVKPFEDEELRLIVEKALLCSSQENSERQES